jgi:hypothetical protein
MESSSPAWLAKDPAAQKHLGKYKEDPQGLVWYVDHIDTGRNGDVAKLRRAGADREVRRCVPVKKLERDYKDVADDAGLNKIAEEADASVDRLMAGFSAQLRGVPVGCGITAIKGKSS